MEWMTPIGSGSKSWGSSFEVCSSKRKIVSGWEGAFSQAWEIYRKDEEEGRPGWSPPHRYDEFPTGYSSAGCSPAEPASASPAGHHLGVRRRPLSTERGRPWCYSWTSWLGKGVQDERHGVVCSFVGIASTLDDPGSAVGSGGRAGGRVDRGGGGNEVGLSGVPPDRSFVRPRRGT